MATISPTMITVALLLWVWWTEDYKYPWGSGTVSELADFWRVPVVAPAIMRCSEVYFALAEAKLAGLLPAAFSRFRK